MSLFAAPNYIDAVPGYSVVAKSSIDGVKKLLTSS
jgi:hypothetical protein